VSETLLEIRAHLIATSYQVGDEDELEPSRDLLEDGYLDSLGIMDLVGFLRQRYGLELEPHEMVADNFRTLEAIAALVDAKRAAEPPE